MINREKPVPTIPRPDRASKSRIDLIFPSANIDAKQADNSEEYEGAGVDMLPGARNQVSGGVQTPVGFVPVPLDITSKDGVKSYEPLDNKPMKMPGDGLRRLE